MPLAHLSAATSATAAATRPVRFGTPAFTQWKTPSSCLGLWAPTTTATPVPDRPMTSLRSETIGSSTGCF
eukprot:3580899-Prymnesium_polylepis.1